MKYHGHLMKSPYNCYFYDSNQNQIIVISEKLFEYMRDDKELVSLTPEIREEINLLHKHGYLLDNFIEEIIGILPCSDDLNYSLNYKLNQLILQVTKLCNFRCNYCFFTENKANKGNEKCVRMPWEIAKQALDFYAMHTRDRKRVIISFYGGEPQIEFNLIKKCVDYANELFEGKKIEYHLTTNASLMNLEMIEFFHKWGFKIVVSLDGPRSIHDKNRKYDSDGSGTFDTVLHNIVEGFSKIPDFQNNVSFNCVYDPSGDLMDIGSFFNEQFPNINVKTSLVNPNGGVPLIENNRFIAQLNYLKYIGLQSIIDENTNLNNAFSVNYRDDLLKFINYDMNPTQLSKKATHAGACEVGINRLYVDTTGNFYVCEKICDTLPHMIIGNVIDGFAIEKVMNQNNIAKITESMCKKCWAIQHCTVCAAVADDGQTLSKEKILFECSLIRKNTESKMLDMIAIYEARNVLVKPKGENML